MKKIFITAISMLLAIICYGQENYVKSYTARDTIKTSLVPITDPNKVQYSVQYLDGLGRPKQSIIRRGSPNEKDLVSFQVYDEYGRSLRQYLPFVRQTTNAAYDAGSIAQQKDFHKSHYDSINGKYAFSDVESGNFPAE